MTTPITVLQSRKASNRVFARTWKFVSTLVALLVFVVPASAQQSLIVSSHSDFSTTDRVFADGETIHIKVEPGTQFEATSVTESRFEVAPTRDGDVYEGTLAMNADGSFTGSVAVADLEGASTAWHVRVKIEDELNGEFEARTSIVVRGRTPEYGTFRVSGRVEAASESGISVAGSRIEVTSDTKLHAQSELEVAELEGHDVVVLVKEEADGTLTALQIFVQDDQSGRVTFRGHIQHVGDASIVVRGIELVVDEQTSITSGDGDELTLEDLDVRMHVLVVAQRSEDGWHALTITARIGDDDDEDDDEEEGEVRGPIEAIDGNVIAVAGIRLQVSERTEFDGVDGLVDLEVGTFVEVEFVTTAAGVHVASEIKVEDEDDEDDEDRTEIEIEGVITALGDRTVTVEGVEFVVTADTEIKGAGREHIEFSALSTGLYVEIEGIIRDDVAVAQKIEIEDHHEHRFALRGEITALGDRTATVGDTEFAVTTETTIQGERGADLTFADLEVGMHALVHLREDAAGVLTAVRIKVKRPFEDDDVEITGHIQEASETAVTVRGHTFAITEETEIEGHHGETISAADLSAGMVAKIEGHVEADGSLVAHEIKVRTSLHKEGRFAGLVTALGDELLTVNGVEFSLTSNTSLSGVASFEDLEIGARVMLWFRHLADGTRLALRVVVKTDADLEAEVKGAIEEVSEGMIVVAGVDVTVTAATAVLDAEGNAASAADLEVGQIVEVEGTAVAGGILATKIKMEDDIVVSGAVDARTDATMEIAGITFAMDTETLVIGRDNALLELEDLKAGAYVEIIAAAEAAAGKNGDVMTAERVLVLQSTASPTASEDPGVPASFRLDQNYPNPFNPTTNITFDLSASAAGHVSLVVYNVLGQEVATLVEGTLSEGTHTYRWDGVDEAGRPAASGIYLYRLRADGQTATRSMILTK